jgi:hypothetical protein
MDFAFDLKAPGNRVTVGIESKSISTDVSVEVLRGTQNIESRAKVNRPIAA